MKTTNYQPPTTNSARGYSLIELMVSVSIFALVMVLAAGSYLLMISISRHVQGLATGIDNLAFGLESMTRAMRTGTGYNCAGQGDCSGGASNFSFVDSLGQTVTFSLSSGRIYRTVSGVSSPLTEPSVEVTRLTFYVNGTGKPPGDYRQPYVTMVISGTTSAGPGKTESFFVETSAAMRGTDL